MSKDTKKEEFKERFGHTFNHSELEEVLNWLDLYAEQVRREERDRIKNRVYSLVNHNVADEVIWELEDWSKELEEHPQHD